MQLETILSPAIIVFSLGMLLVALRGYHRKHNIKLIYVSLMLALFLIKGVLMSLSLVLEDTSLLYSLASFGVLDLIILVFLFLALLTRLNP